MWRPWLCACAALLCACGGRALEPRDGGVDAAVPGDGADAATLEEECAALRSEWQALVAGLDGSCATDADCAWVGAAHSCECQPTIGEWCGTSVNHAAYDASGAGELEQEFEARCRDLPTGICDCGQFAARCVAGTCRAEEVTCCLCWEWDAGTDAPGDAPATTDASPDATAADATADSPAGDAATDGGGGDAAFTGVFDVRIFVANTCDVSTTPASITVPTGTEFTVNWINLATSAANVDVDKVDQYNQVPIIIGLEPGQSYHDTVREWCGTLFTGTFSFRITGCYEPYYLPVDCGG
jgi:hypothetical protein